MDRARCDSAVRMMFFAAVLCAVCGCARQRQSVHPCWDDSDCSSHSEPMVCQQGACRQACDKGLWVGQSVYVHHLQAKRKAVIVGCKSPRSDSGALASSGNDFCGSDSRNSNFRKISIKTQRSGNRNASQPSRCPRQVDSFGSRSQDKQISFPLWVRYISGIEEQLPAARVVAVQEP